MLINLQPSYIRIQKDSMHVDTLERLCKYLNEIWVDFSEDSNSIIIQSQTARLYMILYRLSAHFDIELM